MLNRTMWILCFLVFFSGIAFAGPMERYYGDQDTENVIDLDDSSVAVIELEANPSSGNGWMVQEALSKNVRIVRREFESYEPELLGSPGIERIYVVGEKAGRSDMAFEYRRAYEKKARRLLKYRFNTLRKFREKFLAAYQAELAAARAQAATMDESESQPTLTATSLPSSYNYCTAHGGCPPARDQGQCGGCWAFATQGPLECLIKGEDGVNVDLSEQYLLACNNEGWGCQGGFWAHDYNVSKKVYGENAAGAPLESTMPFKGRNTSCNPPHAKAYNIKSWGFVCGSQNCRPTTDQIKQAIYQHGPVSSAVCVDYAFQLYRSGVFKGSAFPCLRVNHGIVLTGWDDSTGSWILRNSWGTSWGESGGYMRIGYGVAQVGTSAAYVVYEGKGNSSSTSSTSSSGGCNSN